MFSTIGRALAAIGNTTKTSWNVAREIGSVDRIDRLAGASGRLSTLRAFPSALATISFQNLLWSMPAAKRSVFDTSEFPWAKELEANWEAIRDEADALLAEVEKVPPIGAIWGTAQGLATDTEAWRVFLLRGLGNDIEHNRRMCPNTVRALEKVPGLMTAVFSVVVGKADILPHTGYYKGVLRYHLGLRVPGKREEQWIRVGSERLHWTEGKSLIFDDTFEHEVHKESSGLRCVLYIDFLRPLPPLLQSINHFMAMRFGSSPFIKKAIKRLDEWNRQHIMSKSTKSA